jgi:hypothetical protein
MFGTEFLLIKQSRSQFFLLLVRAEEKKLCEDNIKTDFEEINPWRFVPEKYGGSIKERIIYWLPVRILASQMDPAVGSK